MKDIYGILNMFLSLRTPQHTYLSRFTINFFCLTFYANMHARTHLQKCHMNCARARVYLSHWAEHAYTTHSQIRIMRGRDASADSRIAYHILILYTNECDIKIHLFLFVYIFNRYLWFITYQDASSSVRARCASAEEVF